MNDLDTLYKCNRNKGKCIACLKCTMTYKEIKAWDKQDEKERTDREYARSMR